MLKKKVGHDKFPIYKNILILTKTFRSEDASHTHDSKYAVKRDRYLEHSVLCLYVEHTRTHTFIPDGRNTLTDSLLNPDNLDPHKETRLRFISTIEAATTAAVQHCTLQFSPPCLRKCRS